MKNRIEYLREYINSIVLEKNGLEQVFDLEEIKLAKTDKSKVELL